MKYEEMFPGIKTNNMPINVHCFKQKFTQHDKVQGLTIEQLKLTADRQQ